LIAGKAEPQVANKYNNVEIYICTAPTKPSIPPPDCAQTSAGLDPPASANPNIAGAQYFVTDANGNFSGTLKTPLADKGYVWATEVASATGSSAAQFSSQTSAAVAVFSPVVPQITNMIRSGATPNVTVSGTDQPISPLTTAAKEFVCVFPPNVGYPLSEKNTTPDCSAPGNSGFRVISGDASGTGSFTQQVQIPAHSGDYVSVTEAVTPDGSTTPTTLSTIPQQFSRYDAPCNYEFNDCDFELSLIGGIEQSDLSAQNSTTTGFFFLFTRAPFNMRWGTIWFRSRFLGAPSASATNNIVAAASNPSGTLSASNLPQSVNSVDYVFGVDHQFWRPSFGSPHGGSFTFGPVFGFGATTPLDASTVVNGVAVPTYGTNECYELQQRFTTRLGYNPPLPPSGYYSASTGTPTLGCVVQPPPGYTVATAANPGTQITTLAFSNQDRSSFLLKWGAGIRIMNRWHQPKTDLCSEASGTTEPIPGHCTRSVVDFVLGQDQAITGGYLRRFVLKGDAVFPLMTTGVYFFGQSANRLEPNTTFSPLILSPVTVSTTAVSGSSTIPSPNVFVLPFKQQNRDFYSIGVGLDLTSVLTKLFNPAAK
jgi:hypothetical protein